MKRVLSCEEVNELAASVRGVGVGRHTVLHFLARPERSRPFLHADVVALGKWISAEAGDAVPRWIERFWLRVAPPDEVQHAARHVERVPVEPYVRVTLNLGQHAYELLRLVPGSHERDEGGWPALVLPTPVVRELVAQAVTRVELLDGLPGRAEDRPEEAVGDGIDTTPWRTRDLLDDYYEGRSTHSSLWELERLPGFHSGSA